MAAGTNYVRIESKGACPSAEQVEGQLRPLLRKYIIAPPDQLTRLDLVEVVDQGDEYVVRVLGTKREIPDTSRDCGERAQIAAVVVAITIEPAGSSAPAEPVLSPDKRPPPPEKTVVELDQPHETHTLHAQGWSAVLGVKTAIGFKNYGLDVGPLLGVNFLWSHLLLTASASLFPAQQIQVDGSTVALSRYAVDFGIGSALEFSSWQFRATAGAAFDPMVIASDYYDTRQVRLDVGPTATVSVAYIGWRVDPFLALDVRWFPRDYQLWVNPRGEVGTTPQLYLGATAGIWIDQF